MKQFVEEFEYYAHGRLTNTPPVYIWMLSLGISRGFAFVDFYHLQDATRWMETNQVASQSPSLVLILGIWKEKKSKRQPKFCGNCKKFLFKEEKTYGVYDIAESIEFCINSDCCRLIVITILMMHTFLFMVIEITVASSPQGFRIKDSKIIIFTLMLQEMIGIFQGWKLRFYFKAIPQSVGII